MFLYALSKGVVLIMGRGGGKTPERVVELLKKQVSETSQAAISRETGLGLATINDYLKGKGEPTLKTLEILSDYFDVTVDFLRGKDTYELPAALKLLDIYFEFLNSLPEDRQGPAMLFSQLWFGELYYKIIMYLRAAPVSEREDTFKSLDRYVTQCLKIKSKLRNWEIETGGLLGKWNPHDQDIFIPLDNEQNSDVVLIGATPSGGEWKLTKSKTSKPKKPGNDTDHQQEQPVKESAQGKQQRKASTKKAKP